MRDADATVAKKSATKLPDQPVKGSLNMAGCGSFEKHVAVGTEGVVSSETIQLALFGAGRAGSIHLGNLAYNRRVKIVYVVDDMQSKWITMKKQWNLNDTKFILSKNSQQVFEDPSIEAVVVASPTHSHEAIVKSALTSGKSVFCEKPIAGDIDSLRQCYQLADKVGKSLLCAFNRRFDESFGNVRDQVHSGKVGNVHVIKLCSRDSPLPTIDYLRISGGIFHDCAVHDIDIMCWVLGEYPTRVVTTAHCSRPEIAALDDFDTVAAILSFPSGAIGTIDLSRNSTYGYDQRLEVFGPNGMVVCENEGPRSGVEKYFGLESVQESPMWFSFPTRYKQAYINEIEHFLAVVQGTAKVVVQGQEVIAVSRIATAMEQSARTGKYVDLKWEA